MEHYAIDYRFLVARTRASLDVLNYINDGGKPVDEVHEYAGKRTVAWWKALQKDEELYSTSLELLNDNGELEKLYLDGVKDCYRMANESNDYVLALVSMGALIRHDHT